MLALRRRERPSLPVAQEILASFFGSSVTPSGVLFPRIEGRGAWRGARVRVDLETSNTRKSTEPFTIVELEDDLDAIVYTGGAGWAYPAHEPHAAFTAPPLAGKAVVGVPRRLTETIARGPVADRLALASAIRLTIGSEARRQGCATRGVRLVLPGWPMDRAALAFLLDTVLEIGAEARRELAAATLRGGHGRHAEVVEYEQRRAKSRAQALQIVGVVAAVVSVLTLLASAMLLSFMG